MSSGLNRCPGLEAVESWVRIIFSQSLSSARAFTKGSSVLFIEVRRIVSKMSIRSLSVLSIREFMGNSEIAFSCSEIVFVDGRLRNCEISSPCSAAFFSRESEMILRYFETTKETSIMGILYCEMKLTILPCKNRSFSSRVELGLGDSPSSPAMSPRWGRCK